MSFQQLNIGIITQARMTSTRLPGKVLKLVNGKNLLAYHIERLQQTGFSIAIATTTNHTDDPLVDFANEHHLHYFRGSEDDVLSRFYHAATLFNYDIIIRVTSDCPLIDPHLIRNSVEKYLKFNNLNLYMSNVIVRTFARGFDFEIFSYQSLKHAFENAKDSADLEHVTPFIRRNIAGKTSFYDVLQSSDHSHLRLTVDTEPDFELIKQLIEHYNAAELAYTEIEEILLKNPQLVAINEHIEQKKV
jgi:spore coat polysaccharide biosynthesis protein SpsF